MNTRFSPGHSLVLSLAIFLSVVFSVFPVAAEEVAPSLQGVRLQSQGSLYWLQVDEDAGQLWPKLKRFWADEGIELKREQPQLGYMETEWSKDLALDKLMSIFLSDQAPTRRERFRLRVERDADRGTRVFIYHSAYGILFDEEAVYTGYLPASPELEIEMLSRLALFLGAGKGQIESQANAFVTTRLEAKKISADEYGIDSIPGDIDFVREKLQRALARMDADVSIDDSGSVLARYSKVPELESENTEWGIDDSSDLEETGFGNADVGKAASLLYRIALMPSGNTVNLRVRADDRNSDGGLGLSEFSAVLAEQLEAR